MATQLTVDELEKKEEEEFRTGPLSVLTTSVKTNSQVRAALCSSWPPAMVQSRVLGTCSTMIKGGSAFRRLLPEKERAATRVCRPCSAAARRSSLIAGTTTNS